jgi:hypothetical protein
MKPPYVEAAPESRGTTATLQQFSANHFKQRREGPRVGQADENQPAQRTAKVRIVVDAAARLP